MRRLLSVVVGSVLVLSVAFTPAWAVFVNVTYTADNIVGTWFQNGGAPVTQTLGANSGNWKIADSAVLNLSPASYQLIFRVENLGTGSSGNPAGLLVEIQGVGVSGDLLTSTNWEYALVGGADPADFNTLTWAAATQYGNNGSPNIWTTNNNGPIAGISTSAQWIWSSPNFTSSMDQELYLRAGITAVPEPASMTLLALGLASAGAWMRRKKKA